VLALAARSTPLGGGAAACWPWPRVLPRAAVSCHSSLEPSALSHGVGRGGGAVRRRSWSSENRAVRWSPSGWRAVTSRAPRRATLPHFLAWLGNGSSSPGREKGGRPPVERGERALSRKPSRDCPPRPGTPLREAPSKERAPEGRALDGRALDGRALEGRALDGRSLDARPGAPERGEAGRPDEPEEGRADEPEEGRADGRDDGRPVEGRADEDRAAPRDGPASSRSPRYAGRSRRGAPLVPEVRDVRAAGAPDRAGRDGRSERLEPSDDDLVSVRLVRVGRADEDVRLVEFVRLVDPARAAGLPVVLRAGRAPFLGSSSSARQVPVARLGAAPFV
jgi:hypothetical protein